MKIEYKNTFEEYLSYQKLRCKKIKNKGAVPSYFHINPKLIKFGIYFLQKRSLALII